MRDILAGLPIGLWIRIRLSSSVFKMEIYKLRVVLQIKHTVNILYLLKLHHGTLVFLCTLNLLHLVCERPKESFEGGWYALNIFSSQEYRSKRPFWSQICGFPPLFMPAGWSMRVILPKWVLALCRAFRREPSTLETLFDIGVIVSPSGTACDNDI